MLSQQEQFWKENLKAGFVVTCIGDRGNFTYKKSRHGNCLTDRVVELILHQTEAVYEVVEFSPRGSDERQYCSPGFNLPVGSLMRSMHEKFPQYHTSADNKSFVVFDAMQQSVLKFIDIIEVIEKNEKYINTMPFCEPQLDKRGLYPTLSLPNAKSDFVNAMMWVLNLSDGDHDLVDISERSKIPVKQLIPVVDKLLANGILIPETIRQEKLFVVSC